MTTIKAIIFDYGGVFMRTVDVTPRLKWEQRLGLRPGGITEAVFNDPLWDDVQCGRVTADALWANVGARLQLTSEELAALRHDFWSGDQLDEELLALAADLRAAGYRLALLSNAPADLPHFLERRGAGHLFDAFDVVVISGQEGVMKPDPAIYERTLARLEVRAAEAVFVDDHRVNVEAARQLGIPATRFRGMAALRPWLQEVGVPVPSDDPQPLPDIRAVIFDWGGVFETLPDDAAIAEWERRLGLAPHTLVVDLWGPTWRLFSHGVISEEEYMERVSAHLGFPDVETGYRFLEELYTDNCLQTLWVQTVRALRSRYRVALLSNAASNQVEWVRERFGFNIPAEFDVYVNSAVVGISKPNPAIYRLTLEQLGVEPHQAVLVDDRLRNVDAARFLGIHTVQCVDTEKAITELKTLLGDIEKGSHYPTF